MATFVLTLLGDDRPGLVSALSGPINDHGASWERSQMSRLAGKFAGIVEVSVADERYDALVADLEALAVDGLQVALERSRRPGRPVSVHFSLDLLGADRPGIVAEISASLAALDVNIEELAPTCATHRWPVARSSRRTPCSSRRRRPRSETLSTTLEELADELMVDITLTDA